MNLYAYVGNDPVNMSDPTGRNGVSVAGRVARYCTSGGAITAAGCVAIGVLGALVVAPGVRQEQVINPQRPRSTPPPPMRNEEATPLPDEPVGSPDDRKTGKGGQIQSGPLAPENGGTGNPNEDFDVLTGGKSSPAPEDSTFPEGTRIGDNGVVIRPGSKPDDGPRIDIPQNGDKPRETLHYPK